MLLDLAGVCEYEGGENLPSTTKWTCILALHSLHAHSLIVQPPQPDYLHVFQNITDDHRFLWVRWISRMCDGGAVLLTLPQVGSQLHVDYEGTSYLQR